RTPGPPRRSTAIWADPSIAAAAGRGLDPPVRTGGPPARAGARSRSGRLAAGTHAGDAPDARLRDRSRLGLRGELAVDGGARSKDQAAPLRTGGRSARL